MGSQINGALQSTFNFYGLTLQLHATRCRTRRKKCHLTARQAGEIARAANAANVIPMHLSPRYQGEEVALLRAEVAAVFGGNVL